MVAGSLPPEIAAVAQTLLTRPDKNSMEWKAFEAAINTLGASPEKLLLSLGAWPHALALHQHRFLSTHFPQGIEFAPVALGDMGSDLPLADVTAYSVDDSSTIEIDDALSVTSVDEDTVKIGIHIAVPGMAVCRDNEFDKLARRRMSTVYIPGLKIPMLPRELISAFSLDSGQLRPALSLYVNARPSTGEILSSETRSEDRRVGKECVSQFRSW